MHLISKTLKDEQILNGYLQYERSKLKPTPKKKRPKRNLLPEHIPDHDFGKYIHKRILYHYGLFTLPNYQKIASTITHYNSGKKKTDRTFDLCIHFLRHLFLAGGFTSHHITSYRWS